MGALAPDRQTFRRSLDPGTDWVRTNPVWCFEQYVKTIRFEGSEARGVQRRIARWVRAVQEDGVRFPRNVWRELLPLVKSPDWLPPTNRPGVIGLLRASGGGLEDPVGLASSIRAEDCAGGWTGPTMPFEISDVGESLIRLMEASHRRDAAVVPESRGMKLSSDLGKRARGESWTIAALLAVIDAWNQHTGPVDDTDPLRRAVSLVRIDGDHLTAVGDVDLKWKALMREYGGASVVICDRETRGRLENDGKAGTPGARGIRGKVEQWWTVESWEDLANHLLGAGLMSPLFANRPITAASAAESFRAVQNLRWRNDAGALLRAERLAAAMDATGQTPLRVQQAVRRTVEDTRRHLGNAAEALKASEASLSLLDQIGERASFAEIAESMARWGSAMYDCHRFAEGITRIKPLVEIIVAEPRLAAAETRVALFNTQARLMAAIGTEGWESLFRRSIELQRGFDPVDESRTRCYLVHAMLRNRPMTEAAEELAWFDANPISPDSLPFVYFYRADLYRRDPSVQSNYRESARFEASGDGHPLAFYLQSTARQSGRSVADRDQRLRRSRDVALNACRGRERGNLLFLFARFLELVYDLEPGSKPKCEIEEFFKEPGHESIADHYQEALVDRSIDRQRLLDLVPHL